MIEPICRLMSWMSIVWATFATCRVMLALTAVCRRFRPSSSCLTACESCERRSERSLVSFVLSKIQERLTFEFWLIRAPSRSTIGPFAVRLMLPRCSDKALHSALLEIMTSIKISLVVSAIWVDTAAPILQSIQADPTPLENDGAPDRDEALSPAKAETEGQVGRWLQSRARFGLGGAHGRIFESSQSLQIVDGIPRRISARVGHCRRWPADARQGVAPVPRRFALGTKPEAELTVADAVRAYKELGYVAFPVCIGWNARTGSERVSLPLNWHKNVEHRVLPQHNAVGLATGAVGGVVALECDDKDGLEALLGKCGMGVLPGLDSVSAIGPHGRVVVFRYDQRLARMQASARRYKVDGEVVEVQWRNAGGWVVVPPAGYIGPGGEEVAWTWSDGASPFDRVPTRMPDGLVVALAGGRTGVRRF
ncbi:hypothetical protein DFJ74DRAFT_293135 [Hyaloraphidium curvatum]|nr:hypothetical protein DFJ74DRAFT_293135 [Hyaloraphidium curvatum]